MSVPTATDGATSSRFSAARRLGRWRRAHSMDSRPALCDNSVAIAHVKAEAEMPRARTHTTTARRSAATDEAASRSIASKSMRRRGRSLAMGAAAALEDAHRAGLLDGEKTAHVSFRAPPALVEAAKRESGVTSMTELGVVALAMLAQPDPVAAFLKRTRGRLGRTHTLEY
jgi:hypothetical protein